MPAEFDRCRANGGRIRTKTLKGGKYIRICYLDGKSYAGEVKKKQTDESDRKWIQGKLAKT